MSKGKGALARSKSIDHQLDEDRERRQREIQLLILGGAGSGKSTFSKQLRIHHGDGFPELERVRLRGCVYENLTDAINNILDYMKKINIQFEDKENKRFATVLQAEFPRINHYKLYITELQEAACGRVPEKIVLPDFTKVKDYSSSIIRLWSDAGIQKSYVQRHKYDTALVQAEEYYLTEIHRICDYAYIPTIKDVLYIRKPTLGVQEHMYHVDGLNYRVIDVAGQKSQRKKWIHFFEGVTAVMFFASLSGFAESLEEEKTLNSLQDSLVTFQEVAKNEFLERTDIILFLNKRDLFEQKLEVTPLNTCFPGYEGENTPDACIKFILNEFMQRKPAQKQVYPHTSCAIDVDLMRKMIDDVLQIIIQINLRKAAQVY